MLSKRWKMTIDLEGSKLCLSYLLAVISEKCSGHIYFLIKIKSHYVCMCRMKIIKQAVTILSLISGNVAH